MLIGIALLRRGLKIVGTLISIAILLLLACGVLVMMGILPMPGN